MAAGIYEDPLIRPEHVNDCELGGSWRAGAASPRVNLFRMDFRDELVYAGQFDTDLGYPILGNAARSVHQGVELAGAPRDGSERRGLALDGNATLSDNHFVEYRESYGPSPRTTWPTTARRSGSSRRAGQPRRAARCARRRGVEAQHAGRIYLDNNEDGATHRAAHRAERGLGGSGGAAAGARPAPGPGLQPALDPRYATGGYMDYDAHSALVPHSRPRRRATLAAVRVDW